MEIENRKKIVAELQITKAERKLYHDYDLCVKQKTQMNDEVNRLEKQKEELEQRNERMKPKEQQRIQHMKILEEENRYGWGVCN